MTDQWDLFWQLLTILGQLLRPLVEYAVSWSLLIVWVVWWLLAVNWKETWPVLAEGAWLAVVLLVVTGALVWSQMAPSTASLFGLVEIANYWWQLMAVGFLALLALACGWLQGIVGWQSAEVDFEPPAAG